MTAMDILEVDEEYYDQPEWELVSYESGYGEVLPINDRKSHIKGFGCDCIPELKLIDNGYGYYGVLVHNAFDKRKLR